MKSTNANQCLCLLALFSFLQLFVGTAYADKYVAPTGQGTGDGSSAANAAHYRNPVFWSTTVQTAIDTGSTTVWLANGTYTAALYLRDIGHPSNVLTVRATTSGSVTMKADQFHEIMGIYGVQRLTMRDIIFTGDSLVSGVVLGRSAKGQSRWIIFDNCTWQNLGNLETAALNLSSGCRDVTVQNCTFSNVGSSADTNMIYCNGSLGITITDSSFTNCTGDYVRFADDGEYAVVDDCLFHSTADSYNKEFIRVAASNNVSPGNEFFGGNFQFTNNSFDWDTAGNTAQRWGVLFSATGFNVSAPLDYMLDSTEANTLNTGTAAQKNTILSAEMGLDNALVKIYGNSWAGAHGQVAYWHHADWGSGDQGYVSTCTITNWPGTSGTLASAPLVRNPGFEFAGDRRRCWTITGCEGASNHTGLNGSSNAVILRKEVDSFAHIFVNKIGQSFNNTSSTLTLRWIVGLGSNPTGTGVKFKAKIYHNEIKDACLVVAIDDQGNAGYMNSSGTFVPVGGLGTLLFAIDGNGDGIYHGGAGDAMRWYEFQVVMDYSGATPYFTISRSNVNAAGTYPYASGNISVWAGSAPAITGAKPSSITFESLGADVILDGIN